MTMITKPFALENLARRISELMQGETEGEASPTGAIDA
jgi:hypothetical protein